MKKALLTLALLLLPVTGALAQPTNSSTKTTTTSALAGHLSQTGVASVYGFNVVADSTLYAGVWYVLIFNTSTNPADGAVTPIKCYAVTTNNPTLAGGFTNSSGFNSGITIATSTTGCFTKTESTHAFISLDYKTSP